MAITWKEPSCINSAGSKLGDVGWDEEGNLAGGWQSVFSDAFQLSWTTFSTVVRESCCFEAYLLYTRVVGLRRNSTVVSCFPNPTRVSYLNRLSNNNAQTCMSTSHPKYRVTESSTPLRDRALKSPTRASLLESAVPSRLFLAFFMLRFVDPFYLPR